MGGGAGMGGMGGRGGGFRTQRFQIRSVNAWIILICVGVFVFDALLASSGFMREVPVARQIRADATSLPKNALIVLDSVTEVYPDRSSALVGRRYHRIIDGRSPAAMALKSTIEQYGFDKLSREQGALLSQLTVGREFYIPMSPLASLGHFSTLYGFQKMEVWRLITFQFLHGSVMHLFFNMFGLFIFGRLVEQHLGSRRYLAFYLICGIFGGVSYLILNFIGAVLGISLPGALATPTWTPLIGASAGVFGVIVACAYIAPNMVIQLIFPPIPLKMKWFAYGYVAIAAYNLLTSGNNAGGDAAHIGGAIAGYYFIRNAHLLRDFFSVFSAKTSKPRKTSAPKRRVANRAVPGDDQIDRILAKVATQGIQSLTEKERKALKNATEAQRQSGDR